MNSRLEYSVLLKETASQLRDALEMVGELLFRVE